jgi:hypothetical protein
LRNPQIKDEDADEERQEMVLKTPHDAMKEEIGLQMEKAEMRALKLMSKDLR